jgi:hypothetical protein
MFYNPQAEAPSVAGPPPRSAAHEQAATLLARYPNVSEIELTRLIDIYRGFSALDTALILSNRELAPSLDRFTADHRSKVRLPFRQYAGLLFYTVLTMAILIWAISVG